MIKEQFINTEVHQNFNHADFESDEQQQKRTSWCIESDDDEQRLRQELIQRATARLRRRMLEQGLQDVMRQVVSLQTQLEALRVDATTTIDTVSTIFDESKTAEGTQKMNRQMDILEKRLESHRMGLVQLQEQQQQQHHHQLQQKSAVDQPSSMLTSEAMEKSDSNLTAMSMSRLSSLSLMSSIFGRSCSSSAATSRATSVSGGVDQHDLKKYHSQEQQLQQDPFESLSTLEDDDDISQIESIGNSDWRSVSASSSASAAEDHPFYDLAGKRSFGAGSFCGSVYHDNQQDPVTVPAPCNNSAEIRSRRRQRRQRHKQQLEQLQHQSEDDESVISDDLSTFSSISGLSMVKNNEIYLHHPLSPTTPPPNCTGSFFDQIQQYPMMNNKKDPMQAWLSSHDDDFNDMAWDKAVYSQRNVLDEAMSFLDGLSENGSDGGFREDVYLLLENPDLCCRPLSEIETKMNELRRQETTKQQAPSFTDFMLKDILWLLKPSAWCQLAVKYSTNLIYSLTCSSLQWCRFLSVLAAAVVISILKGPEDIRRSIY
ncbi:hypothetical protein HMPREF1544_11394 [Mucor circinelloides 1006PhL]|uniref:Uncharacterized protein n=1 Tax=Mucor circinelloides f. circinelloides (strain 1006PhL) TaxID=1220926 RepID=S2JQ71_MUCC1|nr:hypothetical protein HMPREF1544_11394 [Mucor circinelloides 1006PhL]KAG1106083.1 hypothetical protein G6F42_016893 [Rhizopus arrhizus]